MLNIKMIGNKIAEAIKRTNISQSKLAELLFISPQAFGKWERGESMLDIITFNRLAEILDVDLNYFTGNLHEKESAELSEKQNSEIHSIDKEKKISWDMSHGNWVDADFSGLKNLQEKFRSSNMRRCLFISSDLSGLLLKGNHVEGCDFSNSDFRKSQLIVTHSVGNTFVNCSLKESEFSGSHVNRCNFTGSDFTGVTIKSSDFSKNTVVVVVVWNHTSYILSHLNDIVFNGNIEDCYFENSSFKKVTFREAKLVNTFFKCRTLKGIKFVNCQADKMTYEFLKNGKADLKGLSLISE